MTALKINPANLPDRGEPTRDTRPTSPKIPPHLKVRVLDSPWTKRPHHTKEERKQSARINSLQSRRKDLWTDEQIQKALEMYLAGESFTVIGKAIGRIASAVEWHLSRYRSKNNIPARPTTGKTSRYTAQEDEIIVCLHNAGYTLVDIADAIDRTKSSVATRLWLLKNAGRQDIKERRKGNHE